jgi:ABC-type sulfate transport system substrate-binding protein
MQLKWFELTAQKHYFSTLGFPIRNGPREFKELSDKTRMVKVRVDVCVQNARYTYIFIQGVTVR